MLNDPCLPDPSFLIEPGYLNEKLWDLFFLILSTLFPGSSNGFFCFLPNSGQAQSGMNLIIKSETSYPKANAKATPHCSPEIGSRDTFMAYPPNTIMII